MTKILLIPLIFILFSSCKKNKEYAQDDVIGIWVTESQLHSIIFKDDQFSILTDINDHHPYYSCCDTLAAGSWKLAKGNLLQLNSDEFYNKPLLSMTVQEESLDVDSVFFKISNPHLDSRVHSNIDTDIGFIISVLTDDYDLLNDISGEVHYETELSFENPNRSELEFIIIEILPTVDLRINNLGIRSAVTYIYYVKNEVSNSFIIDIPEFSLDYLGRERLINYYVEVENDSTILFNGEPYIKQ